MAYIYQADTWCDDCAERIMAQICREHPELVPPDYEDESSYDSNEFPEYYDAESEESDGPENCASHKCGGTYEYNGREVEYGTFLQNALTQFGYQYLKSMLDQNGPDLTLPQREWAEYYNFHWTERCWRCKEQPEYCVCDEPDITEEWVSDEMVEVA